MTNSTVQHQVELVDINEDNLDQRIDNFLVTRLKGVPKSMIYRIIRKGEVRVNKKRIKPEYKLQIGDCVRIPPVRVSESSTLNAPSPKLTRVAQLAERILFEDSHILVLNKPAGIAVHGGSGVDYGVIEALRALYPEQKFLELVHRLDKDTSGVLLVAKKRSALKHMHDQLRTKKMQKDYLALVRGDWQATDKAVKAPLLKLTLKSGERIVRVNPEGKVSETRFKIMQLKHMHDQLRTKKMQKDYLALVRGDWQATDKAVKAPLLKLTLKSGERIVRVNPEGKVSETRFKIMQRYDGATLVQASPITGRTHQIRVHCQFTGHPIACDDKYSEQKFDDSMRVHGLNRLFLHAAQLQFIHPATEEIQVVKAPLDPLLVTVLSKLKRK